MNSTYTTMNWIEIPAGQVTLKPGGYLANEATFQVKSFAMARCAVTNSHYAAFMAAGGYENHTWWSEKGWHLKEQEGWVEPRFWYSTDWTAAECPVVGVSWYEARAFCRWLSEVEGRTIDLPTEAQWQRAAQGNDGRLYPWGSQEPNERLCNWNRNIDETTPVDHYPQGAGPFGNLDLCGNVWEWCRTGWESGDDAFADAQTRVLRGGSWSSDSPLSLRVDNRSAKDPNTRLQPGYRNHVTVGFRVAAIQEIGR